MKFKQRRSSVARINQMGRGAGVRGFGVTKEPRQNSRAAAQRAALAAAQEAHEARLAAERQAEAERIEREEAEAHRLAMIASQRASANRARPTVPQRAQQQQARASGPRQARRPAGRPARRAGGGGTDPGDGGDGGDDGTPDGPSRAFWRWFRSGRMGPPPPPSEGVAQKMAGHSTIPPRDYPRGRHFKTEQERQAERDEESARDAEYAYESGNPEYDPKGVKALYSAAQAAWATCRDLGAVRDAAWLHLKSVRGLDGFENLDAAFRYMDEVLGRAPADPDESAFKLSDFHWNEAAVKANAASAAATFAAEAESVAASVELGRDPNEPKESDYSEGLRHWSGPPPGAPKGESFDFAKDDPWINHVREPRPSIAVDAWNAMTGGRVSEGLGQYERPLKQWPNETPAEFLTRKTREGLVSPHAFRNLDYLEQRSECDFSGFSLEVRNVVQAFMEDCTEKLWPLFLSEVDGDSFAVLLFETPSRVMAPHNGGRVRSLAKPERAIVLAFLQELAASRFVSVTVREDVPDWYDCKVKYTSEDKEEIMRSRRETMDLLTTKLNIKFPDGWLDRYDDWMNEE